MRTIKKLVNVEPAARCIGLTFSFMKNRIISCPFCCD